MIRSTCILFGLPALVLQGSSGLHMLLVEQSRCAEHGELVHGDAHPHDPGQSGHAESAELRGTPEAGTDGNHDHCSVYADRRTALGVLSLWVAGPVYAQGDPERVPNLVEDADTDTDTELSSSRRPTGRKEL